MEPSVLGPQTLVEFRQRDPPPRTLAVPPVAAGRALAGQGGCETTHAWACLFLRNAVEFLRETARLPGRFPAAHGPFPHPCCFYREPVDGHTVPTDSAAAVVHHADGNRQNNDPSNLKPAHNGCHVTHHNAGKPRSPETLAKTRGGPVSPETRARISAALTGVPHTPERRAKAQGRKLSPERG